MSRKPKILVLDIETFYMSLIGWGLFDQNFGLNQIDHDWSIASWAAKWLGEKQVFYQDVRAQRNKRDDKKILKGIWKLLDAADIILTQNGKKFDAKKLNARFIMNGMSPPSPYRHIDTLQLAKKHFGFTSNKLEYMTDKLCTKYKKLKHKNYPGIELWKACLAGNQKAWAEMQRYNTHDILGLEELYLKMEPWGTGIDMRVFNPRPIMACPTCTSESVQSRGYYFTNTGKFRKLQCNDCKAWFTEKGGANNLLSKEKRASLKGSAPVKGKRK